MNELSFLNQSQYQLYSRIVARYCSSVNAAIMLSELINRFEYHQDKNELISHEKYGDGWFYLTIDKCEERTCLSRREQDTGIEILEKKGFIQIIKFGLPSKRHFKLNIEKILEIFGLSKKHSSLAENAKLDCTKTPNCIGGKRQTLIYKEHQEEPKEEPQQQEKNSAAAIEYFDAKKQKKTVSESDIYLYFIKLPYETELIKQAINRLREMKEPVGNVFKFLESIVLRLQNTSKSSKINEKEKPEYGKHVPLNTEKGITWEEFIKNKEKEKNEI